MHLSPRHLRRYRQITEILIDHGFGAFLFQVGLSERLNLPRRILRREPAQKEALSHARRLRMAIEDLGPTFIKLGQIMSTRSDLVPSEFIEELVLLQDEVAPAPWEDVKKLLEDELGCPLEQVFQTFRPTPIASASLAQVYPARLVNGDLVVVKIQRPGVDKTVNLDLDILYDFADRIQKSTNFGERFEVREVVETFSAALRDELDFLREGRNADRFRKNFEKEPLVCIPKIYWEFTSRKVIVQEYLQGIKISDIDALDRAGFDRHQLATTLAGLILKEVLEDGIFHADPHPGNLLILPKGILGVLDFGTIGRLDQGDRLNLARLLINVVQMDMEGVVDQLVRMGIVDYKVDSDLLQRELRHVLVRYIDLPLQEIPVADVMKSLEPIIYKHQLRIPSDYLLLLKTIGIMQGVGLRLDPEFNMLEAVQPYLGRIFRQMWNPTIWGQSVLRLGMNWNDLLVNFPGQTRRIMTRLEKGEFAAQIHVPDLVYVMDRLDGTVNRIIYGILISALTLALAFLIPRLDFTWPWKLVTWVIVTGFFILLFLGMRLVWSIFQSWRRARGNSARN